MKKEDQRNIWQFPWQYKESITIVTGIILVGFLLQWTVGAFDFTLLQWPVNGILGFIIIVLSIVLGRIKNSITGWFSGIPMSVTLVGSMLVLGIIMGLTPQAYRLSPHDTDLIARLGFKQMTLSWSFVLLYLLLLLSLSTLLVRRLLKFRLSDYAFYLNHFGLWLLLFAAGLGASDMKRYVMHVSEGEMEWRVYNEQGDVLDLPVAIQLNDFIMEEYPPQLVIIDRETGSVQPEKRPSYFQLEEKPVSGELWDWDITVLEYIHEAVRNSDSTYQQASMPGASPAVLVKATNRISGEETRGWVCVGNTAQLYMTLPLTGQYTIVMTQPEPKKFISDIEVFTEDGQQTHTLLEVNKPLKAGNWMVYQYGYDNEAGKLSSYSSFELVYDPWIVPVYIGIFLLAAGSICMLWIGNKRKEEEK